MYDEQPTKTNDNDTDTTTSVTENPLHRQPYCVTELVLNDTCEQGLSRTTTDIDTCVRRVTQTLVDSGSVISFMTKGKALDLGLWQYVSKITRYRRPNHILHRIHGTSFQKDRACATDFAGNSIHSVGTLEVSFSAYRRSRDEPVLGSAQNRKITITVIDSPKHSLGCDWVLGCDSGFVWPIMSDLFVGLQATNHHSRMKSALASLDDRPSEASEPLRQPDGSPRSNPSVQSIAASPALLSRFPGQQKNLLIESVHRATETPVYFDPTVLYQPRSYYMQDADDRSSHPSKDLVVYVRRPPSINSCSSTLTAVVYPEARDMSFDIGRRLVIQDDMHYQNNMIPALRQSGHAIEV